MNKPPLRPHINHTQNMAIPLKLGSIPPKVPPSISTQHLADLIGTTPHTITKLVTLNQLPYIQHSQRHPRRRYTLKTAQTIIKLVMRKKLHRISKSNPRLLLDLDHSLQHSLNNTVSPLSTPSKSGLLQLRSKPLTGRKTLQIEQRKQRTWVPKPVRSKS